VSHSFVVVLVKVRISVSECVFVCMLCDSTFCLLLGIGRSCSGTNQRNRDMESFLVHISSKPPNDTKYVIIHEFLLGVRHHSNSFKTKHGLMHMLNDLALAASPRLI